MDRSPLPLAIAEGATAEALLRALTEQSVSGVFLIDHRNQVVYANAQTAAILGRTVAEIVGRSPLELVADAESERLVRARMADLDAGRPGASQLSVRFRTPQGALRSVRLGLQDTRLEGREAVVGTMQDITAETEAATALAEHLLRLERATVGTLDALCRVTELRDPYTAGHQRRVSDLAAALGAELGLCAVTVDGLRAAGLIHDVGKVAVPAELLARPGPLNALEFALVKVHAASGYSVLRDIDCPWPIAEVAWQHHERLDGSGYPRGLSGDAICLEARIVGVADVVEAMASHRPFRRALGVPAALAELEAGAGRGYDPAVVAACGRLFRQRGYRLTSPPTPTSPPG